jgi:hypothetical protein
MYRAIHGIVTGGSFTVLIITALLLVSACGGQERDLSRQLLGTWAEASEPLYQVYEFSEDGTVTYSLLTSETSGSAPTTRTGSYELLENSMLVMRMPTETNIFGLTIANDRLTMRSPTITRADGTTTRGQDYVFNRVQ